MELFLGILGLVILIYSAILHEVVHGFIADRLGDPTARLAGRLTLDPRRHIDPVMSILLPLMLILSGSPVVFGAAKPVPVDIFNLREGRKDMALVALGGPLTNFILAIIGALCIHLGLTFFHTIPATIFRILSMIVIYNLSLGIFNLLPIPPLDGSRVVALLLPEENAQKYLALGQLGMLILFLLLLFPIGGISLQTIIFSLLSFAINLLGLGNLPL